MLMKGDVDMKLKDAFEMLDRGETPDEYKKRTNRLKKLCDERYFLEDALDILDPVQDAERYNKKKKRLEKILADIERLS
jgi:hypothetical protein